MDHPIPDVPVSNTILVVSVAIVFTVGRPGTGPHLADARRVSTVPPRHGAA